MSTAIFLVTIRATGQKAVVRARCTSCARNVAGDYAGEEGPMVWRDPNTSSVSLVDPQGKPGLIAKGVADV